MKPIFAKRGRSIDSFFELPHTVYDALVYPVRTSHGATVIVYGHESGLSLCWKYGGEADASNLQEEKEPIIQDVDIELGIAVIHISAPAFTITTIDGLPDSVPGIFRQKLVLAVACADSSVKVVSIPLDPPTQAAKLQKDLGTNDRRYGEEFATLSPNNGHQANANSVSITWTSRGNDGGDGGPSSRPSSRNGSLDYDLLVASSSSEVAGVLLITRLPLQTSGETWSFQQHSLAPFQKRYLTCNPRQIIFNPSHYPSNNHSHLLVADSNGILRIYDPLVNSGDSFGPHPNTAGAFLSSFAPRYQAKPSTLTSSTWQPISSVRWTSFGSSVTVLLSDGQWGIWDVAGSGPTPSNGSATSDSFAISGRIGTASHMDGNQYTFEDSAGKKSRSVLVPMTPNTRRSKQDQFFSGRQSSIKSTATGANASTTRSSGISANTTISADGGRPVESLMLWFAGECYRIPDLSAFWARAATTSSSSGGAQSRGLQRVDATDIGGEHMHSITDIPFLDKRDRSSTLPNSSHPAADILVVGERRLVIMSAARDAASLQLNGHHLSTLASSRQGGGASGGSGRNIDLSLLSRGELDVGGMDRMLDSMAGSDTAVAQQPGGRRVGFDV